jgi:hypothetical protein
MIAIDLPVRILIFLLHPRSRPHMHQGDVCGILTIAVRLTKCTNAHLMPKV